MTHVRTSPFYPQSNGKQERMQGLIKQECIRPKYPQSLDEAKSLVSQYVDYYNTKRLHSSTGYITPLDMLNGQQEKIHQIRDEKLEQARLLRKKKREDAYEGKHA